MRSAKQLFVFFALILLTVNIFASGKKDDQLPVTPATEGLSDGALEALLLRDKTVRYDNVIKTKYFDIIFPSQSEITARLLASRVDELYEKAAAEFETETWLHFPIVIKPETQVFNAYFTSSPYNHIMLLDTPNTSASLAVESETIINTFYHELVHAVTSNIHKDGKNKASLFGDFYSIPFLLNSKLFFIEGATVSMESREGEGRVNSGEAMSPVVQAKLEGNFPDWRDISGARDIYPGQTASYIFGGAFNAWLQNEYGMSTYADFWKECSSLHLSGFTGIFKQVYGMRLDDAWELFSATVPVPETESEDKRSSLDEEARFASLALRSGKEKGIVYTRNSCSVRYIGLDDPGKREDDELFSCYGAPNQLSFSDDGLLLAVSGYMTGTDEAYSVRIFDMEGGSFCGAEIPYSRNAVITTGADGKQYVMCLESAASYTFVSTYLLDDVLNADSAVPAPLFRMELPVFDEIYDTAPVKGGAACLRKTDGVWYLSIAGTDGNLSSWRFPDNTVPIGLSSSEGTDSELTLYTAVSSKSMNAGSDTEPGALSRLAVIRINGDKAELSFQKKAFSGGTHYPAVSESGKVYSISKEYESDTVRCYALQNTEMTSSLEMAFEEPVQSEAGKAALSATFEIEEYHPVSYMTKGVLFPIPGIITSSFSTNVSLGGIGATIWTQTPDGKVNFEVSAGGQLDMASYEGSVVMNPVELYGTLFGDSSQLNGGTFLWDIAGKITFNEYADVNELNARLALGEKLPLSDSGETLTLANGTSVYDWTHDPKLGKDNEHQLRYAITDSLSLQYGKYRKKGMSALAVSGFNLGTNFFYQYLITNNITPDVKTGLKKYDEQTYGGIGLSGGFKLARLLPLPYRQNLTYNLPVSFSASLLDTPTNLLTADADITLFSAEIQRGLPLIPLYCNRFTVNAGWTFANGTPSGYSFNSFSIFNLKNILNGFYDYPAYEAVSAGLNFVMTPDVESLYSLQFNLGINGRYYILNDSSDKKYEVSILGIWNF